MGQQVMPLADVLAGQITQLHRPIPARSRHLSFGPSLHHCLGAALARLQLEIGLGTLLAGLPELALTADTDTRDWQHGMLGTRNLAALPIAW